MMTEPTHRSRTLLERVCPLGQVSPSKWVHSALTTVDLCPGDVDRQYNRTALGDRPESVQWPRSAALVVRKESTGLRMPLSKRSRELASSEPRRAQINPKVRPNAMCRPRRRSAGTLADCLNKCIPPELMHRPSCSTGGTSRRRQGWRTLCSLGRTLLIIMNYRTNGTSRCGRGQE